MARSRPSVAIAWPSVTNESAYVKAPKSDRDRYRTIRSWDPKWITIVRSFPTNSRLEPRICLVVTSAVVPSAVSTDAIGVPGPVEHGGARQPGGEVVVLTALGLERHRVELALPRVDDRPRHVQ